MTNNDKPKRRPGRPVALDGAQRMTINLDRLRGLLRLVMVSYQGA